MERTLRKPFQNLRSNSVSSFFQEIFALDELIDFVDGASRISEQVSVSGIIG